MSHPRPVRIVTDSSASLPAAATAEPVTVVPMKLTIGGTEYSDGSISPEEVVRRSALEPTSTSAPSPGAFAAAIEVALDAMGGTGCAAEGTQSTDVLVVTVASQMSSTYESAQLAAAGFPSGRVVVLDSGTAAGAQGLVVMAAAQAAARSAPLPEVVERARRVAERVHLVASLSNLDHLARSGRVPDLAARAGRAVGVHPLFEFAEGSARARRPALSQGAALQRIVDQCRRTAPGEPSELRLHAAILHAQAEEEVGELDALLSKEVGGADVFVAPFSSVMIVHTGPGLIGLAWWWERNDQAAESSGSTGRARDRGPAGDGDGDGRADVTPDRAA